MTVDVSKQSQAGQDGAGASGSRDDSDAAALVSELRAAQQRLARQLVFTRSITDSLGEGLYAVDAAGRVTFINPAAERMLGWTQDDLLGQDMHERVHFQHADGSRFPRDSCPLVRVIRTGQPATVLEDVFTRRDGTLFPVSYTSAPTMEFGEVIGAVVAFRDVTEERKAREALQRSHEDLERLVAERTSELRAANAQLSASNRELQDFASVASHDLQEPLRKIQAFGDRLDARCGEALGAEGQDYLRRMRNAAERMQSLIGDLLRFARVTMQAQPFARVDLNEVAAGVLGDLEAAIERASATITLGELPALDADPIQMRQLLQNLIANALKFRDPAVPTVVEIRAEAGGPPGTCAIVVRDNGIGFEEKYLDRIFNVFQRLHGRGTYEGTGIGLAVCRKIAERHGGSITASSAPGAGSTFVVTLPLGRSDDEELDAA